MKKHKHSFIRMAAEKIFGSHFEYFRCWCRKEQMKINGKIKKELKKK